MQLSVHARVSSLRPFGPNLYHSFFGIVEGYDKASRHWGNRPLKRQRSLGLQKLYPIKGGKQAKKRATKMMDRESFRDAKRQCTDCMVAGARRCYCLELRSPFLMEGNGTFLNKARQRIVRRGVAASGSEALKIPNPWRWRWRWANRERGLDPTTWSPRERLAANLECALNLWAEFRMGVYPRDTHVVAIGVPLGKYGSQVIASGQPNTTGAEA
jgi:hypothetical protein